MRKITFFLSVIVIFAIPWDDAININLLGSLTRILGMATAALWLICVLKEKRIRKPHWFHVVLFFFLLWNITSFFWSASPDKTQSRITTYAQLAILSWILWDLYKTENSLRVALQAYVLGCFVSIGSTIYNFINNAGIKVNTIRFSGAGMNAVDLALVLSLGLPVAWYLATIANGGVKNRYLKILNFAYIPLAIFAILLTGSRTGIFVVIPTIFYIIGTVTQSRPIRRIFILVLISAALFVLQEFLPNAILERLSTTQTSITTGDLGGRMLLWQTSLQSFSEHPVFGIGSGGLSSPFELGGLAHNTFLSVLAETGMIGFAIFMVLLGIVVSAIFSQNKSLSRLWITIMLAWSIGVLSLSWEFRKPTWLFFSLIIISAHLYNKTREAAVNPDPRNQNQVDNSASHIAAANTNH